LVYMMLKASDLVMENPEINQMDLNPVMIYEKGASIVDARMLLRNP
jgi:acyl-CoA synthetase (NDP forming)